MPEPIELVMPLGVAARYCWTEEVGGSWNLGDDKLYKACRWVDPHGKKV
jgi:hypothetical protein